METDDEIARLMKHCEHCSCYWDEDDIMPCCNCGDIPLPIEVEP